MPPIPKPTPNRTGPFLLLRALVLVLAVAIAFDVRTSAHPALRSTPQRSAPREGGAPAPIDLPTKEGSLKFATFGDFGDATERQYQMAAQMVTSHDRFPFEMVALLGDNLYGSERPLDFLNKFESPYKPLLAAGVTFYAALGNHDAREQRNYKLFNMNSKRYYSYKAPRQNVRFFALESTYMNPEQVKWIENELRTSNEAWKIVYLHHPLYSSAARHGSDLALRKTLEPLFVKYGVSLVLAGHDHVYERIRAQNEIPYFVVGSAGELRRGDLRKTGLTEAGFDADNAFLMAEIIDEAMYFNAVSRTGQIVDSGIITLRKKVPDPSPITPSLSAHPNRSSS